MTCTNPDCDVSGVVSVYDDAALYLRNQPEEGPRCGSCGEHMSVELVEVEEPS